MFPQLALLSRLYRIEFLRRRRVKGLPVPAEGYSAWDHCKPVPDSPGDPPLTEDDVAPQDSARIKEIIMLHMKYQGRPRFINKNGRNTRRIRFLHEIFKDALFIHLTRDPRAVVASLLKVNFWPTLKLWCCDKITPEERAAQGGDPVELAAHLWVEEVKRALDDKAFLSNDQYLHVYYEDLVENRNDTLSKVLTFCELDWNDQFDKFVNTFTLKNMNHKFKTQLNQEQLNTIKKIAGPVAESMGYKILSAEKLR